MGRRLSEAAGAVTNPGVTASIGRRVPDRYNIGRNPAVGRQHRGTEREFGSALPAAPEPSESADIPEPPVRKVTVTFFGDAASAMGFTWYTDAASQASDLLVTQYTKEEAVFANAMTFTGTVSASSNSKDELVHKAVATGLESATTYYYKVGDASLDIWSDPGVFTTAPVKGTFSFIDISDTQIPGWTNKELVPLTISKALETCKNAGFIINNGDNADSNLEFEWDKYLKLTRDSLVNIPVMPTAGNHEAVKSCFIDHYNLDTPAADNNRSILRHILQRALCRPEHKRQIRGIESFSPEQLEWMKADIEGARSAGADWIIIVRISAPIQPAGT